MLIDKVRDLVKEKLGRMVYAVSGDGKRRYYLIDYRPNDDENHYVLSHAPIGLKHKDLLGKLLVGNTEQWPNVQIMLRNDGDVIIRYEGQWNPELGKISGGIQKISVCDDDPQSFKKLASALEKAAKRSISQFSPRHDPNIMYEDLGNKTQHELFKVGKELSGKFFSVTGTASASFAPIPMAYFTHTPKP